MGLESELFPPECSGGSGILAFDAECPVRMLSFHTDLGYTCQFQKHMDGGAEAQQRVNEAWECLEGDASRAAYLQSMIANAEFRARAHQKAAEDTLKDDAWRYLFCCHVDRNSPGSKYHLLISRSLLFSNLLCKSSLLGPCCSDTSHDYQHIDVCTRFNLNVATSKVGTTAKIWVERSYEDIVTGHVLEREYERNGNLKINKASVVARETALGLSRSFKINNYAGSIERAELAATIFLSVINEFSGQIDIKKGEERRRLLEEWEIKSPSASPM